MKVLHLFLLFVAVPCGVTAGSVRPVSPVGSTGPAEVESSCPTFSWTLEAEAAGYEVVVYEIDEGEAALDPGSRVGEPVLLQELPRGANVWVPPNRPCLTPGFYGWAVRVLGADQRWSEPALFRVGSEQNAAIQQPSNWFEAPPRSPVTAESTTPAMISAAGRIHSTNGGFVFPDDTVQKTAFNLRMYYAAVHSDGSKLAGNVASTTRVGVGEYDIDLGHPPAGCVAVVSRGRVGTSTAVINAANGHVQIPSLFDADVIRVLTQNQNFTEWDTSFLFLAACPPPVVLLPPF